jgi:hypothetical protein
MSPRRDSCDLHNRVGVCGEAKGCRNDALPSACLCGSQHAIVGYDAAL